jgi:hypothetical protein
MDFTDDLFGDSSSTSWQPFDQLPAGSIASAAAAAAAQAGHHQALPEMNELHKRQMSLGGVGCCCRAWSRA